MAIHFGDGTSRTCLACGASFTGAGARALGATTLVAAADATNDAGIWNSFPARCRPRHHINVEAGKRWLVPLRGVDGERKQLD